MSILLRIAIRNVIRNRRRTSYTLLALTMSVAIILLLHGYATGLARSVVSELVDVDTGALSIYRAGYHKNVLLNPTDLTFEDLSNTRSKILAVNEVLSLSPRLSYFGILSPPENGEQTLESFFVQVRGMEPDLEVQTLPLLTSKITEGTVPRAKGEALVNSAFLESSKTTQLVSHPWQQSEAEEKKPALIVGKADGGTGGIVIGLTGHLGTASGTKSRQVLLRLQDAQEALAAPHQITEYAVSVKNLDNINKIQTNLQLALGENFEVLRWDELSPTTKEMLSNQTFVLSLVELIFVAVVIASLFNTMQMTIRERTREVGTLLSVGIRPSTIVMAFSLEGAFLGMSGALGGTIVGIALVALLNKVGIPATMPSLGEAKIMIRPVFAPASTLWLFAVIAVSSVICTLFPAIASSRMKPTDALRSI